MAKIKPVREEPKAPEPEPLKKITSVQSVSEPQEIRKHALQFIADEQGNNWRCACGHVYPRPPIEVLLKGTLDEWLDPIVKEHENAG